MYYFDSFYRQDHAARVLHRRVPDPHGGQVRPLHCPHQHHPELVGRVQLLASSPGGDFSPGEQGGEDEA